MPEFKAGPRRWKVDSEMTSCERIWRIVRVNQRNIQFAAQAVNQGGTQPIVAMLAITYADDQRLLLPSSNR